MTQQHANSQQQNNGQAQPDPDAPIRTLERLNNALVKWAPDLQRMAPTGRPFDFARFKAIVMSCASRTPKIVLCSVYSLKQAVSAAAELGFELGGASGEAYLIPYENRKKIIHPNNQEEWITVVEATFMPGYKGFLRLARESGAFRDLGSDVIRPEDTWEPIRRGPDKLTWGHIMGEPQGKPMMKIPLVKSEGWGKKRTETRVDHEVPAIRGAYAYAKLTDPAADDIVRVIWQARLEEIRLRSKAGSSGPWVTDYAEMAQKTAIRNLWKHLPRSGVMERAEELDNEFSFEDTQRDGRTAEAAAAAAAQRTPEVSTQPTEPAKAKTARVAERVAQRNAKRDEVPPAAGSQPANDEPPPSSEPPAQDDDGDHGDERQPGEEG